MNIKFKKSRRSILFNTVLVIVLVCAIFSVLMIYFRNNAERKAYNELRSEANYIKKDLSIRIRADMRNLVNLANFAATLHEDNRSYNIMLNSFEPIGLVTNIGVLTPDGVFTTKLGQIDLSDKISYEEELKKGSYISGRTIDITVGNKEIIRCASPIISGGETIAILYGGISLDTISEKYEEYVKELDAQLFVYDKETGRFIVDTINETPGDLSMLIDREYNNKNGYNNFMTKENGLSVLKSTMRDEDIYVYYTGFKSINWGIVLGRYESDLFREMHTMTRAMMLALSTMLIVIIGYFLMFVHNEKKKSKVVHTASEIKKLLLEINQRPQNITKSLQMITEASCARSVAFMDERGDTHDHIEGNFDKRRLSSEYRKRFKAELFRYISEIDNGSYTNMSVFNLDVDEKLQKQNEELYDFFTQNGVKNVIFSSIAYNGNNGILSVVNPKNEYLAQYLINEIAICFSIAIYNKNHLNRTHLEATTDALTGVLNRTAYESDLSALCKRNPANIACIYIDVNELHLVNNKLGHVAGDEMLVCIANLLKNTFADGKIYRIGGDEFLVFVQNIKQEDVKVRINAFFGELDKTEYNVAMGISYRSNSADVKKIVKEAERRMYDSKANFYQKKMQTSVYRDDDIDYIKGSITDQETDIVLSAIRDHFNAVIKVTLDDDTSRVILAKAYPDRHKENKSFSNRFAKYIDEAVHPDFHRNVISFLNFDVLKRQLAEGIIPTISYKKLNGEIITLSVYNNSDKNTSSVNDTLWFFAKG